MREGGRHWALGGHPAEVMRRVGWEGGSHMQGEQHTGEQRERECCSQMQRRKQSSCIDLKGSSGVDAASLALPGRSGRHTEVDGHLLCMQGLTCLESGPGGMYPLDQMRMRVGERI